MQEVFTQQVKNVVLKRLQSNDFPNSRREFQFQTTLTSVTVSLKIIRFSSKNCVMLPGHAKFYYNI